MALETGTYISDLVVTNPTSSDPKSQGDDHLRLLKSTIKTTFPGIAGAVTPTHTELNYVDGVTSAIQTQLDDKAPLDSPALTGTPTTPTALVGTTGTQIASLDFVIATSLAGTLPGQVGNASKFLGTDGTNAGWTADVDTTVMLPLVGTKLATTTATESLSNKSLTTPVIQDSSDTTKKANFVLSGVTAGQNRNITVADENIILFTGYLRYLGKVSASNSATVDIDTFFSATYDDYVIECNDLVHAAGGDQQLSMRIKTSASYLTTGYTKQKLDGSVSTGQPTFDIMTYDTGGTQTEMFSVRFVKVNDSVAHAWSITTVNSTNFTTTDAVRGAQSSANALTGVRFYLASTNIVSGDFRVYGVRKS